jgi:hypothetical protein
MESEVIKKLERIVGTFNEESIFDENMFNGQKRNLIGRYIRTSPYIVNSSQFYFCLQSLGLDEPEKFEEENRVVARTELMEIVKPFRKYIINKWGSLPIYFQGIHDIWLKKRENKPNELGHFSTKEESYHSAAISIRRNLGTLGIVKPIQDNEYEIALELIKKTIILVTKGLAEDIYSRYKSGKIDRIIQCGVYRLKGALEIKCEDAEIPIESLNIDKDFLKKLYDDDFNKKIKEFELNIQ